MTSWKDVAIGSASTLMVTVVSGVAIWYVTREVPQRPPAERLVYEVQKGAAFQSTTTKLGLQTVRIANLGDAPAASVKAVIDYPTGVDVVDKTVSMSSGAAGAHTVGAPSPQRLELTVPSLIPGETLTLSILLNQPQTAVPGVAIRSDKTIATTGSLIASPQQPSTDAFSDTLGRLLPLLFALQIPLALYFSRRFGRFVRFGGYERSLNNTAFALLHQGLVADAADLLRSAIAIGEADVNVFSNQALCHALQGDFDASDRAILAAELFDPKAKGDAVLCFNRALIALVRKDRATAASELQIALKRRGHEIRRWCALSRIFQEHAAEAEDVKVLVGLVARNSITRA